MPPPRLVATIGLHGSASTWVFNVVRELLVAVLGEAAVLAAYAEELAQLPAEAGRAGRHLVVKSHHGSEALHDWLAAEQAQLVLSVRDPRDACVSMVQRFKAPLKATITWIAKDCDRLTRLAQPAHPLLRYEDRFFAHSAAAESLAQVLGVQLEGEVIRAIAGRYETQAVRRFSQGIALLPPGRVSMVGTSHRMDRVTHIHEPHIGDGRCGKWRELPAPVQGELTRVFAHFLDRFGYAH